MRFETTLKREIVFSGVGLHQGIKTVLTLMPSEAGAGILFKTKNGLVAANYKNAVVGVYALTIKKGGVTVSTFEHLLAALYGAGVDNVICQLEGSNEVPLLDGSSRAFSQGIARAGVKRLKKKKRIVALECDFLAADIEAGRFLKAVPAPDLEIRYFASYEHPFLGAKYRAYKQKPGAFVRELSGARTFSWTEQVKAQKKLGLIKGGNLTNALLFTKNGIANREGLRYKDEIIRHKLVDFIGALALLPFDIKGCFMAYKSGHKLDVELVKQIGSFYS